MVFRKKGLKNAKATTLYSSIALPDFMKAPNSINSPIQLTDAMVKILIEFLSSYTKDLPTIEKYFKNENLRSIRQLQLDETKKIVYSLRETDQTSKEAMDFLKEKLTILSTERDNLAMLFLSFKEKIEQLTEKEQLIARTEELVNTVNFVETKSWEKDLDYFRTRFLLQREQDEADQELKDKFIPEKEVVDVKLSEFEKKEEFTRDKIVIEYNKKFKDKLEPLIKEFNVFLKDIPPRIEDDLEGNSRAEILARIKKHEEDAFDVGKELYTLKREQGILTLKTYEIIQTIRSRLLNITGSIASRKFLRDAFNELINTANTTTLSVIEMKEEIVKIIIRLLRIIGEIAPSELK
jgi:hypothetical protein